MVFPIEDALIMVILGANIVITLMLVVLYFKSYRKLNAKFTLGLMFFALAFMLGNIMNFYFYDLVVSRGDYNLTSFQLSVGLFQLIALVSLLYVTWK